MRIVPRLSTREAIASIAIGSHRLSTLGFLDLPGRKEKVWGALWEMDGYGSGSWIVAVEDDPSHVLVMCGREEVVDPSRSPYTFRTVVTQTAIMPSSGRTFRRFVHHIRDHLIRAMSMPAEGGA